jgi:hypothetical protein
MNPRGCFHLFAICVVLALILFQFTGCTASTPQARAQKNPGLLESLPPADRDLVLKSTISEGMSKDAVFLAWGKPDSVTSGSANGRPVETWRYAALRPVYGGWGLGMGLGYGPGYYHRGYVAPYAGYQFTPGYVPVTSSVVQFKGGRVAAWETADAPGRPR